MNADRIDRLVGESAAILDIQEQVSRVAPLDKPVLVVGERGTGKELIAARVHYLSERWGQPFLKINCAAISESLLDSELFGHEAGAFSGAVRQHQGVFERAHGGTLFLDELATTSPQVQEKILRVIEYGEFSRLGSESVLSVDVRLVAATNSDLPKLAAVGKFRSDLLDRLAFDVLTLPPLRARQEDIMLMAEFFALGMVKEMQRDYFPGFTTDAERQLVGYDWPGNVRELKNVVERAIYRSVNPDQPIESIAFDPFDSPYRPFERSRQRGEESHQREEDSARAPAPSTPLAGLIASGSDFKSCIQEQELALIREALSHCQHNQKKTAELLGLTYHQLRGYLRKYEI